MIKLPYYTWFVSAMEGWPCSNIFSGTAGTDPDKGCFEQRIFTFKVRVLNVGKEDVSLHASFWIVEPFGKQVEEPAVTDQTFPCDQAGIDAAEVWLNENLKAADL